MIKKFTLVIFVFILLCSFSLNSEDWDWDEYGITWSMPDSFKIEDCDAEKIGARDKTKGDCTLRIQPWKDANATAVDVCNKGISTWSGWSNTVTTEEGELQHDGGFTGYYKMGTGMQAGRKRNWVVIGLIDPNSPTNFFFRSGFDVGFESNFDIIVEIYNSFKKK